MLFCGQTRKRLEPVGEVGSSLFNSPVLHCVRNHGCGVRIKGTTVLYGALERLICFFGQALTHYAVVKYIACKNFVD